tara:strand:- start:2515 stop:3048 length:534 start_codon:yes stop_codon:yes gene_type:complete
MKINKKKLQQIIKEEIESFLEADDISGPWGLKRLAQGGKVPDENPEHVTEQDRLRILKELWTKSLNSLIGKINWEAEYAALFLEKIGGTEGIKKYVDAISTWAAKEQFSDDDSRKLIDRVQVFMFPEIFWEALQAAGISKEEIRSEEWSRGPLYKFLDAFQWQMHNRYVEAPAVTKS